MHKSRSKYAAAAAVFALFLLPLALMFGCSQVNPAPSAQKQWTVMIFEATDNDLEEAGFTNINELELVGSSDQVNFVAQTDWWHHTGNTQTLLTGEGVGRWYITKDNDMTRIKSNLIQTLPEINTATAEAVRDFVIWAAARYPASHYMLIISSHGGGWRNGSPVKKRGFGQDFTTDPSKRSIMNLSDFKAVLPAINTALGSKKLDILGIDACLNAMVEVGYQFKDYIDILNASEENIPGNGFPYTTMATDLVATPTMSPRELATDIVNRYNERYSGQYMTTLSAIDLSKISEVETRVKNLAAAFTTPEAYAAVRDIVNSGISPTVFAVQSYGDVTFRDLWHLADTIISQKSSDPAFYGITVECGAVKTAVEQAVILSKYTTGATGNPVSNSHGLSIYVPTPQTTAYDSNYGTLDFSIDSGWGAFLQKLI